jgi:hypothetical protein
VWWVNRKDVEQNMDEIYVAKFLVVLLDQENGTTSFVSCFWCKEIDLFRHSPRLYHQDFHTHNYF